MKKIPTDATPVSSSTSSDVEIISPSLVPLQEVASTAKSVSGQTAGPAGTGSNQKIRSISVNLTEVCDERSVESEIVPFTDSRKVEQQSPETSGKKCSSGQMSFSSKILLCGGSGQERESKRKEVDENNPSALNRSDGTSGSSRSRKSSRKGSKKKSKETIAMGNLPVAKEESAGEQAAHDADPEPDAATTATATGPSEDSVAGKTSQNSNKSCCFCWCCCCSCSCLSVKNCKETKESNKNGLSSLEHFFKENDEQLPSAEEIRSWAESFDKLMKCPWGRKVFREFLKCEYSEENILFWMACEDLKMEEDPKAIEEKCRVIYDEYISILSPKEVSLDSQVREIINKNMMNPSKDMFSEGQLQIYTLMHRDSYPRFVNSPLYKQILEMQLESNRSAGPGD